MFRKQNKGNNRTCVSAGVLFYVIRLRPRQLSVHKRRISKRDKYRIDKLRQSRAKTFCFLGYPTTLPI